MRFILGLWFFAALTVTGVQADSARDIARIHTEAIGGKTRMDQMTTLRATGRVLIDGRTMTFQLIAERPNHLRMETQVADKRIIQATDGVAPPWQLNPDANPPVVTELSGDEAAEFAADAEFDDPLVDYEARGYAIDYAGEHTLDGRRVIKLLVSRRLVTNYFLLLDAETYFIVRKQATRTRSGREVQVETVYDDFRPVAGVILPHRYAAYADGHLLHETVLEMVEPNAPVPVDSFSRPILIAVPK
ncbi:MAG: hypothetical protein KBF26_07185 [Opitutaceae bacterium]|nr:hypothetical protein [Opitutaceae bacterium]